MEGNVNYVTRDNYLDFEVKSISIVEIMEEKGIKLKSKTFLVKKLTKKLYNFFELKEEVEIDNEIELMSKYDILTENYPVLMLPAALATCGVLYLIILGFANLPF